MILSRKHARTFSDVLSTGKTTLLYLSLGLVYSSEPGHVKITTHQLPISLLVKITAVFLLDCTVTVGIVHLSLHPKVFSHLNPTESKQSPNTPLLLRSSSLSDIQHPGRSAIGLPSLRMGEKDNGLCARPG